MRDPNIHARELIDSGEYQCLCGWVPSWYGASLEEQVADHHAKAQETKRCKALTYAGKPDQLLVRCALDEHETGSHIDDPEEKLGS